jgi:glycosyltransferase involved in cell wall biosynthesis
MNNTAFIAPYRESGMVTIICSNYNSAAWINGYCASINNQLLEHFHVTFVDAASTDNSLRSIEAFPFRKGINISIIRSEKRISLYHAWNMAIEASNSDYCMNVNTDDRLFPGALHIMTAYARKEPNIDVFYSRCFVAEDPMHSRISKFFDGPEFSFEVLQHGCYIGPFPLLKRASVLEAGLFEPDFKIAGDYEMWLRMASRGYRFRKVPEAIGSYYLNPHGLSSSKDSDSEKMREHRIIWEKYRR